ncbi:MAG: hypothetical protein H6592_11180 [Flavobacteriales bacterium]|nr:hypothetical protein [Flavobacteriales bacterium]
MFRIGWADRGHGINAVEYRHLVGLQLLRQELPVGTLQEVALAAGDSVLDHVLQVVRSQHHLRLGIAPDGGDVGRHEQALELHDIELLLAQQADEPDVHIR